MSTEHGEGPMEDSREMRVLIVDDEPLSRRSLRRLAKEMEGLEVVGECGDGEAAVAAIEELRPDLVLLDIQMPGMTGLEVIRAVGVERMPPVVLVTAYDDFAVDAFAEDVVDYVLKPVERERFVRAVGRARARLRRSASEAPAAGLLPLLVEMAKRERYRDRFVVRDGQRMVVLRTAEIEWVEASHNYVHLHTATQRYVLRETLGAMERMLDPEAFARVHRSAIVNVGRVRSLESWASGEYVLHLASGAKVTTGRSFRGRVKEAFGC